MPLLTSIILLSSLICYIGAQMPACSTSSTECTSAANPYCVTIQKQCNACITNSHCTSFGGASTQCIGQLCKPYCTTSTTCQNYRRTARCDTGNNRCEPCQFNNQCPAQFPTCYSGICGECSLNSQCGANQYCVDRKCSPCNHLTHEGCPENLARCHLVDSGVNQCRTCSHSNQCSRFPLTPYCKSGNCQRIPCTLDTHCDAGNRYQRFCQVSQQTCSECKTYTDCDPGFYCKDGFCTNACTTNSECQFYYDHTFCSGNICIPCTTNAQCTYLTYNGRAGVCNNGPPNHCSLCTQNSDCDLPTLSKCINNRYCDKCVLDPDCSHIPSRTKCVNDVCHECRQHTDCTASVSPYQNICSPVNKCGECLDDTYCTLDKARCGTDYKCATCTQDSQCSSKDSTRIYCNSNSGKCIDCRRHSQCSDKAKSQCSNSDGCTGCQNNVHCAHFPSHQYCRVDTKICVECLQTPECRQVTKSRCDLSNNQCTGCVNDADCKHFDQTKFCISGECLTERVTFSDQVNINVEQISVISVEVEATYEQFTTYWYIVDPNIHFNKTLLNITIYDYNLKSSTPYPKELEVNFQLFKPDGNFLPFKKIYKVNQPPADGTIDLIDKINVFLGADIKPQNWVDPEVQEAGFTPPAGADTSLLYRAIYGPGILDPKTVDLNSLTKVQEDFTKDTTLPFKPPIGDPHKNYIFSVILEVKDFQGAINRTNKTVEVPLPTFQELIDALDNYPIDEIGHIITQAIDTFEKLTLNQTTNCPECSSHGRCSQTEVCECDSGFMLSGCSLKLTDFEKLNELKKKSIVGISSMFKSSNESIQLKLLKLTETIVAHTNFTDLKTLNNTVDLYINQIDIISKLPKIPSTDTLSTKAGILDKLLNYPKNDCKLEKNSSKYIFEKLPGMVNTISYTILKQSVPDSRKETLVGQNFVLISERLSRQNFKGKTIEYNASIPAFEIPNTGIDVNNTDQVFDLQYFQGQDEYQNILI